MARGDDWDHELPVNSTWCPYCHQIYEAAGNMTGTDQPQSGDVTMCANCGIVSCFDFDVPGHIRPLNEDEKKEILADEQIQFMQWAWHVSRGRTARPT